MTKQELIELSESSKRVIDLAQLEAVVGQQEDASLKSPGVYAHYYRFFYRLTQLIKPALTVELGTHVGISSACLADGFRDGKVITVNNHVELFEHNRRSNVTYLIQDSLEPIQTVNDIVILFIDTDHDGVRCLNEFELYKDRVLPGGLIFFDDIHLLPCMEEFWKNFNPAGYEKFELPVHGDAGFGVLIKNSEGDKR